PSTQTCCRLGPRKARNCVMALSRPRSTGELSKFRMPTIPLNAPPCTPQRYLDQTAHHPCGLLRCRSRRWIRSPPTHALRNHPPCYGRRRLIRGGGSVVGEATTTRRIVHGDGPLRVPPVAAARIRRAA